MCGGREGSRDCNKVTTPIDQPWLWVVLTVTLWVGLMILICVLRTCTHRKRRHRFLNKVIRPVLEKIGVKVIFGDAEERPSPPVRVYCTALSDQPPSYEAVMSSVNHAYISGPPETPLFLQLLRPPSYDEVAAMTSRQASTLTQTSQSNDVSSTSQSADTSSTSQTENVAVIRTTTL